MNSIAKTYLIESLIKTISIRGGNIKRSNDFGQNHIEISLPIPGKENTAVCVQKTCSDDISADDIIDVLCEAQSVLDAVDLSMLLDGK